MENLGLCHLTQDKIPQRTMTKSMDVGFIPSVTNLVNPAEFTIPSCHLFIFFRRKEPC